MRVLTIISGAILIVAGVFCLANPGQTFVAMAFVLGLGMLIAGASQIIAYFGGMRRLPGSGWMLADGALTVLLAAIVLANRLLQDVAIPMVFGMWLMMAGIMRIASGIELKKFSGKAWVILMGVGILSIAVGMYGFFHPLMLGLAMAILLGCFFIMQGINVLSLGLGMPNTMRGVRKWKSVGVSMPLEKKSAKT